MILSSKRLAISLLLLVFLLGVATGALVTPLAIRGDSRGGTSPTAAPSKKPNRVERLAQELQLDPAQKTQLKEIIDETAVRCRGLSDEVRPRYDEIRYETRATIQQILNDDQKQRFQKYNERVDRERKEKQAKPSHQDD